MEILVVGSLQFSLCLARTIHEIRHDYESNDTDYFEGAASLLEYTKLQIGIITL
jgi:hypothetical protein